MVVPEHVFSAAVNGRMDVLREYFASGDRDPNETLERNGWTLLDGACMGRRTEGTRERRIISCEAVSFLLSQGASVDFQDPGGTWHRPLVIAAASCSTNDEQYRSEDWVCAALKLLRSRHAAARADRRRPRRTLARRRSRGARHVGAPLRMGAGTRYRQPAPDAVRASRRARVAYYAAPPRRLQARTLFLAVEARLVVAPAGLRAVPRSGIWLVGLVVRASGTKQLTSKLLRSTPTPPSTRSPAHTLTGPEAFRRRTF